ncbi:MAG: glycine cleavage system transcriptional repressor [Limisphaerales bacterium]|jgi:glycine cleavage system transcriptional repressor
MKSVVSIIGHDRPGLVSDVTRVANEASLNIEDSRMTVLGGEFAVLMALSGDSKQLDAFESALSEMAGDDLAYIFRRTHERESSAQARPYAATIIAMDHPGIVASIASFFAAREINIYDLDTAASRAPHTGTPIFNVRLTAEVPVSIRSRDLKQAFADFCDEQDLDGSLEAIT